VSVLVIVGLQWGDEGKGKIVDLLTKDADIVVRFQGGNNAGHTLVINNKTFILHHIPSGIFYPHTICVLGNGMVIDPEILISEIESLKKEGVKVSPERLIISEKAHIIMPYHKLLDQKEKKAGNNKIGTTGRGIGPCYEDKIGRKGFRFVELLYPEFFRKKLEYVLEEKNYFLKYFGISPLSLEEIYKKYVEYGRYFAPYLKDVSSFLWEAKKKNKNILFEGAQGTFLDIDHGTYPYVTSSNTVAGNACCGVGLGPSVIDKVIGITKAYTTRVGSGPFPTELTNEVGNYLREKGREFGSTTGRPRRCGWLDLVMLKTAVRLNGIDGIIITKFDVLDGLPELKICTAYEINGEIVTEFPADPVKLNKVVPIYETLPGWRTSLKGIKKFDDFPEEAKNYIKKIENFLGLPIYIISIGPARESSILLKNPFLEEKTSSLKV